MTVVRNLFTVAGLFALTLAGSAAWAQADSTAAAASQGGGFASLIPLLLIFVIFYFLIIRPQSKKMKEHGQMIEALRRGDRVVTGGGIEAAVTKIEEGGKMIEVEIAPDVRVRVLKSTISEVVSRSQPVSADGKAAKNNQEKKNSKKDKDK